MPVADALRLRGENRRRCDASAKVARNRRRAKVVREDQHVRLPRLRFHFDRPIWSDVGHGSPARGSPPRAVRTTVYQVMSTCCGGVERRKWRRRSWWAKARVFAFLVYLIIIIFFFNSIIVIIIISFFLFVIIVRFVFHVDYDRNDGQKTLLCDTPVYIITSFFVRVGESPRSGQNELI